MADVLTVIMLGAKRHNSDKTDNTNDVNNDANTYDNNINIDNNAKNDEIHGNSNESNNDNSNVIIVKVYYF